MRFSDLSLDCTVQSAFEAMGSIPAGRARKKREKGS
jgi:hypothetical protein